MSTPEYQKGLKKLLNHINPDLRIGKDALELLADLLSVFNMKLVEESKINFKTLKKKEKKKKDEIMITPQHVQNAVKKLLKPRMRSFAMSEGQRSVFRYCNNLLHYDEKIAVEQVEKSHHLDVLGPEFNKSLKKMLLLSRSKQKFTAKGKTMIANALHELCKKLAEKAVDVARGKRVLSQDDMMTAVNSAFTPKMFNHAHGHGSKFVFFFTEGLLDFKVKNSNGEAMAEAHPRTQRIAEMNILADDWKQSEDHIFSRGIRQLLNESHANMQLSSKAISKLDSLLTGLAPRLAMSAVNLAMNQNSTELEPLQLKAAINEVFPPNLARHAVAEGSRVLTLMNSGFINFAPKQTLWRSSLPEVVVNGARGKRKMEETKSLHKQKKQKTEGPLSFTTGLRNLLKEIHGSGSFSKRGVELLNSTLLDLFRRIGSDSVRLASQKNDKQLTSQEIQRTVRQLFPRELKIHAVCAGNKAVLLHSTIAMGPASRTLLEMQMSAMSPWQQELQDVQEGRTSRLENVTPFVERREPEVVESPVWSQTTQEHPAPRGVDSQAPPAGAESQVAPQAEAESGQRAHGQAAGTGSGHESASESTQGNEDDPERKLESD